MTQFIFDNYLIFFWIFDNSFPVNASFHEPFLLFFRLESTLWSLSKNAHTNDWKGP